MRKIKISACFCDIPPKKLIQLVRMRFVEGRPTQELMTELESGKDREYLATVALLDVKEKDLLGIVESDNPSLLEHLLSCRARAKQILERRQIKVKEREPDVE